MPREGRDLEKLVALLESHLGPEGIQVTSPDYILGRESKSLREVDITLRSQVGSAEILVIVECRDRQGSEDVTWMEQLASKRKDVGANKAIAVSSSGFTSGAVNLAGVNDIELRTMEEIDPAEILLWFAFNEITGFKRSVNFAHISIKLSRSDKAKIELYPETLAKMKPVFDIYAPIFLKKKDQSPASFMDIWACAPTDAIYSNILPGGNKVKYQIELNFSNDQDRFQLVTSSGVVDITSIEVYAELWIEVEKKPLTAVRIYRDEKETIAQNAEFQLEHMGKKLVLDLNQYPQSGKQFVAIRAKDGSEVNARIVLISVSDVVREHLEEVARKAQTITYEEIASVAHLDLEVEANRNMISKLLNSISRKENEQGKPLLSALVVSSDTFCPGNEFFILARELDLYNGSDDLAFFQEELRRVYKYWQSVE